MMNFVTPRLLRTSLSARGVKLNGLTGKENPWVMVNACFSLIWPWLVIWLVKILRTSSLNVVVAFPAVCKLSDWRGFGGRLPSPASSVIGGFFYGLYGNDVLVKTWRIWNTGWNRWTRELDACQHARAPRHQESRMIALLARERFSSTGLSVPLKVGIALLVILRWKQSPILATSRFSMVTCLIKFML